MAAQRIAATGPMTLADYMADCLMHPQFGYYATRDPFGASGDFTTAPEISQMFGELIGLCLAQTWMDQGAPAQITLAEIGPGRGTLRADALRATRGVVDFHAALSVHFIETSPTLRKRQAEAVPDATWHDSIETLPQAPLYLVANEFFDALPIRQFTRDKAGWREHMVGVQGDTLLMGLSAPAPIALLEDRLSDTKEGDIVEAGQVILRMRNIQARADFDATMQKYLGILASIQRLQAEADGKDGVQVVVLNLAGHFPFALGSNYPEFPDSCLATQFSLVENIYQVLVDRPHIFLEKLADECLREP